MPTVNIRSGIPGVAGSGMMLLSTAQDFEYRFPIDLATALQGFLSKFELDAFYTGPLATPGTINFGLVEYVGGEMQTDQPSKLVRFNIYLERALTNTDPGVTANKGISFTVARVKRFIEDNNHFEDKLTINRLVSIDELSGAAAPQLFNETDDLDPHVQSALLTLTYDVQNPAYQG